MSTGNTALSIRELGVAYSGVRRAHVPELDLSPGQCAAVVGQSGSGKSTVLLSSLGLAGRNAHVSGSVQIFGQQIVGTRSRQASQIRARATGLIMQTPVAALNPVMRVGDFGARVLRDRGVEPGSIPAAWKEGMRRARLDERFAERYPHELSGGQGQRVAIALALASGARLLFADEPTSALDLTHRVEIIELLRSLQDQHDIALLLVTHDLSLVRALADQILVMSDGRVVEQGNATDVLANPRTVAGQSLVAAEFRFPTGRVLT
ncbi:MAG: ATP-binding cassette domain-containing protein [Mycobacterium sp.]